MTPARAALALVVASSFAACQCARFADGTAFACVSGTCPEGYSCAPDNFCDPTTLDDGGGAGGGNGGGAGGGNGGGAGGGTALNPCSQAWCWEHPTPWGAASFDGIHVSGANDVWLSGENGAIFHWNGLKWQQLGSPSRSDLNDIWVSPEGDVWSVGDLGTVVHLENGRFVDRGPPGVLDNYNALAGVSATDFWAVGTNSRISRYVNGAWADLFSAPPATVYWSVSVADPNRTVVVGDALQAWTSSMLMNTPRPTPVTLRSVWVNPGGELWVAGAGGALFKAPGGIPDAGWVDGGNSGWLDVPSNTTGVITALWGTDGGDLYYGGAGGIFVTTPGFSGQVSAQLNINALDGTSTANIWAATSDGHVVRRSIAGGAFSDIQQQVGATTLGLRAVTLSDNGVAWAAGVNHTALRRTGLGVWSTVPVQGNPASGEFWEIWSDRSDNAWAVGNDPVRLASFDPGSNSFVPPAGFTVDQPLWAVWGNDRNDIYAGGDNTYLIHWDGGTWTQMNSLPRAFTIEGIWGASASEVYVVGSNATILKWDGAVWSVENDTGGGSLYGISGGRSDEIYAVGQNGVILHRNPRDAGWEPEVTGVTSSLQEVAVADGRVMAVADDGNIITRQADAGWRRLGSTARDALPLYSIAGARGRGFLTVGDNATILRWTP